MSGIAIQVEGLSKQYRIGQREPFRALGDALISAFTAPIRYWRDGKWRSGDRRSDLLVPVSGPGSYIWALKDVSFEVERGEVMGIIGPNGAGKSTLLKILSRITEPTEGRVEIHGRVGSLLEVGTGFHAELTGRENIYLNGVILGMKKAEIDLRFDEIVNFSGLEQFIDTPVKYYSSGMYVRLGFAVAAHLECEILILDEVLAVGDAEFQRKCLGKLSNVAGQGRTVLFVSHNLVAIRGLCGSAIWLEKGQIAERGSAYEVVKHYEENNLKHFHAFCRDYTLERNYEDIKDSGFYISRVEMLSINGEHTNTFKYNEKLILIVHLCGEPIFPDYSVEFRIYGETGQFISMGASGSFHDIYFDKRVKKVKIEIGPLILTDAKYMMSLSIVTGRIRADTWDNACFFHISECSPFTIAWPIGIAGCVLQQSFSALE